MTYTPEVDDYVIWTDDLGQELCGWVYFASDSYITIEVAVKEKPDNLVPIHKKVHVLVVCYPQFWHQLKYVRKRDGKKSMVETSPSG